MLGERMTIMKTIDELLALDEDTLQYYVNKMPELDGQGDSGNFWSSLMEGLLSNAAQLEDEDPDYAKEAIDKIKGEIHVFRFYLEIMDFPSGSDPDPWAQLNDLETVAKLAIHTNPKSIDNLKNTINAVTSKEALGKFSDIFDNYTINRGLPKETKNKKIDHIQALQNTIAEAEASLTPLKLKESDETQSKKIGMVEELLSKQKKCCESAASVLTLSTYDLKSLVELPDETLTEMHATLKKNDSWDEMVNKCIKQLAAYEASGQIPDKDKLIGTIKALKLIMILNGQTHVTSQAISNLDLLENNILKGIQISYGQQNGLKNLKTAIFNANDYNGLTNLTALDGKDREKGLKRRDHEKQNLSGMLDDLKTSSKHLSELFSQPQGGGGLSTEKMQEIQAILNIQQTEVQRAMVLVGGPPVVGLTVAKKAVSLITKDKALLYEAKDVTAEQWLEQWRIAKNIVEDNKNKKGPQNYKISKKNHPGLLRSFIVVDGIPYATELKQYLGEGGFGKVKVVQTEAGNNFAVKVESIKKTIPEKERAERNAAMQAEREILKELGKLHGIFEREKFDRKSKDWVTKEYSIMKLELGRDIFTNCLDPTRKLVDDKKDARYKIAIGCLDAIQALHDKGIVHRDIKPENFMMNEPDGVVMIVPIDFGLSRKLKHGELAGKAGTGGTPGYVAPEMVNEVFSYATDVYALGKMLNDNFGINIPLMYDTDSGARPSIEDVVMYLKTQQAQEMQTPGSPLSSFSDWIEEQNRRDAAEYSKRQAGKKEKGELPLPPIATWKEGQKRERKREREKARAEDVSPIMHLRDLQAELSSKTTMDEKPENVESAVNFQEGFSWKKAQAEAAKVAPKSDGTVIHVQDQTNDKGPQNPSR
jgi:serine/threonine protein kinase